MPRFYLPQLLLLWLLAGCQSSRPAYYFGHRPAPAPEALAAVAPPDSATSGLGAPAPPTAAILPPRSAPALAGPLRLGTPRRHYASPLPLRRINSQRHTETALRRGQPRQPQRHLAQQSGFDPGPFVLFLLITLVVFLIVKFPLVTLIVLGVLALTALGILISLTTGHWSFG